MIVLCAIFWTLVAAGAQLGFIFGVAYLAYVIKMLIERKNDREYERKKANRCV